MEQTRNGVPPSPQSDSGALRDLLARVASVETGIDYLRREIDELKSIQREVRHEITAIRTHDFRILAGMIITLGLGMGGLMAKGFGWL